MASSVSSLPLIVLTFLFLSSNPISASDLDRNYKESLHDSATLPNTAAYDYIIIGGGTAGCPLAATLSQRFKVLVLERGGNNEDYPETTTQDGFIQIIANANRGELNSPAQHFTSVDGVPNLRGRVLGGSSSVNAGFYSRAQPAFFDAGTSVGIQWDMGLVNASYEWVERMVVHQPKLNDWQTAVKESLLGASMTPFNGFSVDHLAGTKIGGTIFGPDGRRRSAAQLLAYSNVENLTVALHATVEKIIFEFPQGGSKKPLAKGVLYRDSLGRPHNASLHPEGEVILSAGALGSPQLLLLSGIGSPYFLRPLNIPLTVNQPFVGQFLADNPRGGVTIVSPVPIPTSLIQVVGISKSSDYFVEASTTNIHLPPRFFPAGPSLNVTLATLLEKIAGPNSTGSLWLSSTNVHDNPVVQFNYFSSPVDMQLCVAGMRKIAEMLKSPEMEQFKFPGALGGKEFRYVGPRMACNEVEDLQLESLCRRSLSTIWHYHGGCLVGKVVDPEYRVIGVDSLRVVDGSTFSISPGTNPQATVMMLGRYMGQRISEERVAARKKPT
ncbi:hypothetical protein MRB53_035461 [Persea americana]|uniref:Uncharacterized protein n=1 Tax=Persea americana TaxID=3435 RepID=A0ACC2K4Q1_PERAE|nr:hypothetical protein MRB53_035461 [Persea americana]